MLSIGRREKQSIYIQPNQNLNPEMTVRELFKDGYIEIFLNELNKNQAKIAISAPLELDIIRAELIDR